MVTEPRCWYSELVFCAGVRGIGSTSRELEDLRFFFRKHPVAAKCRAFNSLDKSCAGFY